MKRESMEAIIKEQFKTDKYNIRKLSGDASTREYYELEVDQENYIVCSEAPKGQQSTDFIRMNALLDKIRRPRIIYYNLEESIIIQESLGHKSLNLVISKLGNQEREALYKQAVDDIFKYQEIDIKAFVNFENRSFDIEKISFEFELAVECFLEKYLNLDLDNFEKKTLDNAKKYFVDFFESNKKVVCHRDYHGRNLIVKNGEVCHIDFQDARIGPELYDLCSLVEDCYFQLTDSLKEELKAYFFEKSSYEDMDIFNKDYNIVASQRIFKAIGSFTYLTIDKNKKGYEKYIGHAFENLRTILEKESDLKEFKDVLVSRYYEN